MANLPRIALNYFEARGRAQFIRYYFACRGVPFVEERLTAGPTGRWPEVRDDRSFAGPFQRLPVLQYGDRSIAETLVIQAFLYRELGDDAQLDDDERLQHQMLISSLASDVMTPIAILLYADLMFPGCDYQGVATRMFDRLRSQLRALDRALEEWDWCGRSLRRLPMLADCMLWEELAVVRTVFGARIDFAALPQLLRFEREFVGAADCKRVLSAHPGCPITARPNEAEAIARIQQLI
jgi:glutathione S-transferase